MPCHPSTAASLHRRQPAPGSGRVRCGSARWAPHLGRDLVALPRVADAPLLRGLRLRSLDARLELRQQHPADRDGGARRGEPAESAKKGEVAESATHGEPGAVITPPPALLPWRPPPPRLQHAPHRPAPPARRGRGAQPRPAPPSPASPGRQRVPLLGALLQPVDAVVARGRLQETQKLAVGIVGRRVVGAQGLRVGKQAGERGQVWLGSDRNVWQRLRCVARALHRGGARGPAAGLGSSWACARAAAGRAPGERGGNARGREHPPAPPR